MTLRESLTGTVESWARLGHPALLERFVLRHGKAFTPAKRIGRKGKIGLCFMNAAHFVFKHEGATYVEGFVTSKTMGFFPIHHAWATLDGKTAIDPTLDAANYEYFGVEIETAALRKELIRNKVYGILDTGYGLNTKWMFKLDPELEGIVRDVKPDPELKKIWREHMKQKKRLTNVQFVKQMMEYSNYGALAQMFIMDALGKQAKKVAFAKLEDLGPADGLVSREAWKGVAAEIYNKLREAGYEK